MEITNAELASGDKVGATVRSNENFIRMIALVFAFVSTVTSVVNAQHADETGFKMPAFDALIFEIHNNTGAIHTKSS